MTQTSIRPLDLQHDRVAVLMGGSSSEREVSLMSGQGVLQALQSKGLHAQAFDPGQRPLSDLIALGITRVFIAMHGRGGEDGSLQGALELLGIPYTGSGVMASAIAMDKVMTKRIWTSHGLRNAASRVLNAPVDAGLADQVCQEMGLPLIVKPPHEGSSIGVTKVTRREDMAAAIALCESLEPTVLVESFIQGPELTCAVVHMPDGLKALPVIRIEAPQGAYDYQNKYFTDVVRYHCPSGLPAEVEQQIQQMSLDAFEALGCRGWGRADFMLSEKEGLPYLLEMNTSPGMTSHSLVPMAARVAGMSYEDLCWQVLSTARLDHDKRRAN